MTADPRYVELYQRLRADPDNQALQEQLHARYLELGRGGITPGGLPFPSHTDPVAEGADAIRALAEALDPVTAMITPQNDIVWSGAQATRIAGRVYLNCQAARTSDITSSLVGGNLPPGFRPTIDQLYPAISMTAGFAPSATAINIQINGDIILNFLAMASASRSIHLSINFPSDH